MRMLEAAPPPIGKSRCFPICSRRSGASPPPSPAPPRGLDVAVHASCLRLPACPTSRSRVWRCRGRPVAAGRRFPCKCAPPTPAGQSPRCELNWLDDAGNRGGVDLAIPSQEETNTAVTLLASNPGLRWALFSLDGDDFPADNRAAAAFLCVEQTIRAVPRQPGGFSATCRWRCRRAAMAVCRIDRFLFQFRFLCRRQTRGLLSFLPWGDRAKIFPFLQETRRGMFFPGPDFFSEPTRLRPKFFPSNWDF